MTSLRPVSNRRPSTILMLPRTSNAALFHAAQRHVGVGAGRALRQVDDDKQLRRSERSVGVARDARAHRAIVRVASRSRPLVISLSAPLRSTTATSGEPDTVIARRKPSAMASTPTNTPTTPAMPIAAVSAAALRSGKRAQVEHG